MQIDLKSVKRNWQWLKISRPKDHLRFRIALQSSISSFFFVSTLYLVLANWPVGRWRSDLGRWRIDLRRWRTSRWRNDSDSFEAPRHVFWGYWLPGFLRKKKKKKMSTKVQQNSLLSYLIEVLFDLLISKLSWLLFLGDRLFWRYCKNFWHCWGVSGHDQQKSEISLTLFKVL